jgi:Ni,Fe-hydrogenase I large subunit
LSAFVNSSQLGLFANGYWGHPGYKLPPGANLMAVAHYLEALDWQRDVIKVHAILGSKNPHPQTFLVGRMATTLDLDSESAINAGKLATIRQLFDKARRFVEQVYIPDLLAVAPFYTEWAGPDEGIGNFMTYGKYPDASGQPFLPAGIIQDRDLGTVHPVDQAKIA